MIDFANKDTAPLVRCMWKACFGDTEESMDIFFSRKYRDENTLIYFEKGEAVASLQMLPYTITFYGERIPFVYLAGLCTLPEYRQKGYMAQLIHQAHEVVEKRNIPLAILIPAEEWLYHFYEKYGYTQVFEKDNIHIPLDDIIGRYSDAREEYIAFDSIFGDKDFCVQKSFEDFEAIKDDYLLDVYPTKTNLSGMARTILPEVLLGSYVRANRNKDFRLRLIDNSVTYNIKFGELYVEKTEIFDIEVDISLLTRLLFGYKVSELGGTYSAYFEEHKPIMNLMLE